jgi:hypothetical protein
MFFCSSLVGIKQVTKEVKLLRMRKHHCVSITLATNLIELMKDSWENGTLPRKTHMAKLLEIDLVGYFLRSASECLIVISWDLEN